MPFEEFYQQTFKTCFRFFYYRSVGFENIEDLCQEAYLRFYNKYLDKLQDPEESKKILFGICRNLYKEWVKNQKTKDLELFENYEYSGSYNSFDASQDEDFVDTLDHYRNVLHTALAELNDTVRKVINLRFIEGKTRGETAEILGISEDNVHTYQKRGVKYLKEKLNNKTFVPPNL